MSDTLSNSAKEFQETNPVIAVITIQLNENESDNLEIRYNDNPKELAESFCRQKNLDTELIALLQENIHQDKQIALKELFDQSSRLPTQPPPHAAAEIPSLIQDIHNSNSIKSNSSHHSSLNPPLPKPNTAFDYPTRQQQKEGFVSFNDTGLPNQRQDHQLISPAQPVSQQTPNGQHAHASYDLISDLSSLPSFVSRGNINNNVNTLNPSEDPNHSSQQPMRRSPYQDKLSGFDKTNPTMSQFIQPNSNSNAINYYNAGNNNPIIARTTGKHTTNNNPSSYPTPQQQRHYPSSHQQSLIRSSSQSINSVNEAQNPATAGKKTLQSSIQSMFADLKFHPRTTDYRRRSQSLNKSLNERLNSNAASSYLETNPNLTFSPQINPVSEKIVEEKFKYVRDHSQSTHQRLYEMAQLKQKDQQRENSSTIKNNTSKSLHKSRSVTSTNVSSFTVTERLYNNSSKHILVKHQELEKQRREKERKLLEECTHKPQLNEVSLTLSMQKRSETGRRIENELLKSSALRQMKLTEHKTRLLDEEMKHCTFKPKISETTPLKKKLDNTNLRSSPGDNNGNDLLNMSQSQLQHFEIMFENAKHRQFQKHMPVSPRRIDKQCTFKPEINENSKKISSSFQERQAQTKIAKQERQISQIRDKHYDLTDKQTGQQFFHPHVGRGPLTERKSANMSVTEYLYSQSIQKKHQEQSTRFSHEQSQASQIAASSAKMNEKSRRIMQEMEEEKLQRIFTSLDSDGDGEINANSISISNIDALTLELISPVLYEMEDFGFTLTYPEFADAIQRLLKTMTTKQKADFFNYSKSKRTNSIESTSLSQHSHVK